jgi:hypothetical protein
MSSYKLSLVVMTLGIPLTLVAGCSSDSSSGAAGSGGTAGSGGGAPSAACAEAASEGVRVCVDAVNAAWESCYSENDAPCTSSDSNVAAALSSLETTLQEGCADGDFLSLSLDSLVARLQNSCASEANSIAWRAFGGPQGAVWSSTSDTEQACLGEAHRAAATMVSGSLSAVGTCLTGDSCDAETVDTERKSLEDTAVAQIEASCDDSLADLIAVDAATFVARAAHQVDCMTATAHADTSPLTLDCGPTNTDFEPTRGEWVQIVVDGDKWGTLCGDNSPYAFQVRLAPEGGQLDKLIVGLQGGGVCAFEEDCVPRFEDRENAANNLFNAMDDDPLSVGIASTDSAVNPFYDWTMVYLPYCNQDVFAGGGVVEDLNTLQLPRYGSTNMRAAVQMVRDVIWKIQDGEGDAGFRPDEIVALFGGWSAGGYGALYNYHWFLDDLQWPRTAAFPDAGGALDNGELIGVAGLGLLKIPGWGMLPNLPPYCFAGDCAVGPILYNAISPRLKQVPEQQMLIVSNPFDDTQRRDAFFTGFGRSAEDWRAQWFNTMRQDYCDNKDLPGIHFYYTSVSSESTHVVTLREELWLGEVAGEVMADWFEGAISDPDNVQDRAEEADFAEVLSTPPDFIIEPYPCEVAP